MTGFWQLTLANLKMTLRNRMAIFWLMMFPLLFILMFGFLIPDGDFSLRVGVSGADTNDVSAAIVERMEAIEGFEVSQGEAEAELAELADGNRAVVVNFSEGTGDALVSTEIVFDESSAMTTQIGVSAIERFLYDAEAEVSGQPRLIQTTVRGIASDQFRFIDFLVPGILAMAMMTNGVIALSSTFVSYRERGILRRVKATPFPLWAFIFSKICVQMLIAMAQVAILLGTSVLLFDLQISSSYVSLVLMVALGALAFLSIGFAISAFARNSETAAGIANVIVFPMLFLGGVFFPVDQAPNWLRPVTSIIPVTYLADSLREIILDGATIFAVWPSVLVLLATSLIGMAIAVRFFRWEARAT